MPTLRKLEVEFGKDSLVPTGYASSLPEIMLFKYDTNEQKPLETIQGIEEGWQVLLHSLTEFHRTSKIKEIVSKEPGRVVFKTQTSIYELTELVEDAENN